MNQLGNVKSVNIVSTQALTETSFVDTQIQFMNNGSERKVKVFFEKKQEPNIFKVEKVEIL